MDMVSSEVEKMRSQTEKDASFTYHQFPPACLTLLRSIEGNSRCLDCGDPNPQWAAIRYGALVCLQCSGIHRSLGVQVSAIRSVSMDEWRISEVVSMLEGGNGQLGTFFERHALTVASCPAASSTKAVHKDNVQRLRYKTKAALFYRKQMEIHVEGILTGEGPYRGREGTRKSRHHPIDHRNSTVE